MGGRLKSAMIPIQTFSGQFAAARTSVSLPPLGFWLPPLTNVLAGVLICPAGHIPELFYAFVKFFESASDDMMTVGEVLQSQQGPRFRMQICYCGDPRQGNDLLKPLCAPLKPQDDNVRVMPYLEAQSTLNPAAPVAHFQTDLFLPQLDQAAIATITAAINAAPPLSRVFSFLFTALSLA